MNEFVEDSSPGWEAIDAQMRRLYGDQEPRHFATIIPAMLGGEDPIDGISAYRTAGPNPHWHFVTYGFSELHSKEWDDPAVSGFGFELTFRLHPIDGEDPPLWALNFLQNLGRYVFQTGNAFESGHHMNLNGPIALGTSTEIKAVAFIEDPALRIIETPHGSLTFLQVVRITLDELEAIKRWNSKSFLDLLSRSVPSLVTSLGRTSALLDQPFADEAEAGIRRDGSSTALLYVDSLDWRIRKRLLGSAQAAIVMGANGVRGLKSVLPGRLPFGREFVLISNGHALEFKPADSVSWVESQEDCLNILTVSLPPDDAVYLESTLMPKEGVYQIRSCKGLTIRVEKSYIKDREGDITEVIG